MFIDIKEGNLCLVYIDKSKKISYFFLCVYVKLFELRKIPLHSQLYFGLNEQVWWCEPKRFLGLSAHRSSCRFSGLPCEIVGYHVAQKPGKARKPLTHAWADRLCGFLCSLRAAANLVAPSAKSETYRTQWRPCGAQGALYSLSHTAFWAV
jgi:hypothetical protein